MKKSKIKQQNMDYQIKYENDNNEDDDGMVNIVELEDNNIEL